MAFYDKKKNAISEMALFAFFPLPPCYHNNDFLFIKKWIGVCLGAFFWYLRQLSSKHGTVLFVVVFLTIKTSSSTDEIWA